MEHWNKIKSVFGFLVKHKEIILVIFLFCLLIAQFLYLRYQNQSLLEENQNYFQETSRDLSEMRQTYEAEKAKLEEIDARRQQEINQLREDYDQRILTLEQRTKARRVDFVRETNGDPQEMASRLTKRLGWGQQP